MPTLRDDVDCYRHRVKDGSSARGRSADSAIGPFLEALGYDGAAPEVDCVLQLSDSLALVEEARAPHEVRTSSTGSGQLAAAFLKSPALVLGIVVSGSRWSFFSRIDGQPAMDPAPFAHWHVLAEESPPLELLSLLPKSQFSPDCVRMFARHQRTQVRLLAAVTALLTPASTFTSLAIAGIETRPLTPAVVAGWEGEVAFALRQWTATQLRNPPPPPQVTTPTNLLAFETVKSLMGPERAIAFEDTGDFKIHVATKTTWVFARLLLSGDEPQVWVPLPRDQVTPMAHGLPVSMSRAPGWTAVALKSPAGISELGDLFRTAYLAVKHVRGSA